MMAGSDGVGSGARRHQGRRVSRSQRHIFDIPIDTCWRCHHPQPLPIMGLPHFPDLSNQYTTSGGRGGGMGVAEGLLVWCWKTSI